MTQDSEVPGYPPEHVLATFGLGQAQLVAEPHRDETSWHAGETVLTLVADNARAAWSAEVRETLDVPGLRIARPIRASDGRYVVSGWRADSYLAGHPEPRYDETVSVALRLHAALADEPRPRFLLQPPSPPHTEVDVFTAADRAAWEDVPLRSARAAGLGEPTSPDGARSLEILQDLATLRQPVTAPNQLVHGDLFGTVLFAGAAAPGIRDITPYWRPATWAAAVVVVDAIAWGGADSGLLERWSDLPEWSQMLLRALIFRLAVHALHPRSSAGALTGLQRVTDVVRWHL